MLDIIMIPIHRAGWPFIAIFASAAVVMGWLWEPLGFIGAVLTLWCIWFFRNPDRHTPVNDGLIISPADGIVQLIDTAAPPPELGMSATPVPRVCVFMNVFNVHVNRVPCDGTIKRIAYSPGKFLNASLDKASIDNERQALMLERGDGKQVAFVQIAGLVARRILTDVKEGAYVSAGERFGMIRFGSRVDVYLPEGSVPLVCVGQAAVGGETVLADLTLPKDAPTVPRIASVR